MDFFNQPIVTGLIAPIIVAVFGAATVMNNKRNSDRTKCTIKIIGHLHELKNAYEYLYRLEIIQNNWENAGMSDKKIFEYFQKQREYIEEHHAAIKISKSNLKKISQYPKACLTKKSRELLKNYFTDISNIEKKFHELFEHNLDAQECCYRESLERTSLLLAQISGSP